MLRREQGNVLNAPSRNNIIFVVLLAVIMILAVQTNGKRRSIKDITTKPPSFKLVIFTEKPIVKLGEDIKVHILLLNEGEGDGIVSRLFFNEYSTTRVPKNSITFDIRASNGNHLIQNKDKVYYPQYAQATLKSLYALSPDEIIGFQVNLSKDENFLYAFDKDGSYTIQAVLEAECRNYIEDRIKAGAIKESELGNDPQKTLEKAINGVFKSNIIRIEIKK